MFGYFACLWKLLFCICITLWLISFIMVIFCLFCSLFASVFLQIRTCPSFGRGILDIALCWGLVSYFLWRCYFLEASCLIHHFLLVCLPLCLGLQSFLQSCGCRRWWHLKKTRHCNQSVCSRGLTVASGATCICPFFALCTVTRNAYFLSWTFYVNQTMILIILAIHPQSIIWILLNILWPHYKLS